MITKWFKGEVVYRACKPQTLDDASYCTADPLQCILWRSKHYCHHLAFPVLWGGKIIILSISIIKHLYIQTYSFKEEGAKGKEYWLQLWTLFWWIWSWNRVILTMRCWLWHWCWSHQIGETNRHIQVWQPCLQLWRIGQPTPTRWL